MLNIILFGPQGAGKGTQAKLLAEKFDLEHIEPGRRLREIASQDSELGRRVDDYIHKQGILVPTELLINEVLGEWIASLPKGKGVVADGTPRRLNEAKLLLKMLAKTGREIDFVFLINLSEKETYKRLAKRLTCKKDKQVYIEGVHVPKGSRVCPDDGDELYQRDDDINKEAIKGRLDAYHEETSESIDYFRKQGKVIDIKGEQSIEKVHQDIISYIEKHKVND